MEQKLKDEALFLFCFKMDEVISFKKKRKGYDISVNK